MECIKKGTFLNNDDELIVATPYDSGTKFETIRDGSTQLTVICKEETALEESKLSVFLELSGTGHENNRPGIDIVAVLDVSDSMEGENLKAVKAVIRALIDKLDSSDRLSLVTTFSDRSKRLCPFRQLSIIARDEINKLVDCLDADIPDIGCCWLEMAVQLIHDRKYASGRPVAILLLSDGVEIQPIYLPLLETLPVHTFGFGGDQNFMVLMDIAGKSAGGTYSTIDVTANSRFAIALSACLANLLTVAVIELELRIINQSRSKTNIEKVSVGTYSQIVPFTVSEDEVVVSFGNVYAKETCKVRLDLILSRVSSRQHNDVLSIDYSYRMQGKVFNSTPVTVSVRRVANPALDKFQFFNLSNMPDMKNLFKPTMSAPPSASTNIKKQVREFSGVVVEGANETLKGLYNRFKVPNIDILPKSNQPGLVGSMLGAFSKTPGAETSVVLSIPVNDSPSDLNACDDGIGIMTDQLKKAFDSVKVIRDLLIDYLNQQAGFEASLSESSDPIRSKNVKALGDHIDQAFKSVKAIEDILNQVVNNNSCEVKLAAENDTLPVDDIGYVTDQLKQAFDSVRIIREILADYMNQYSGFEADSSDPERAAKVKALGDHINQTFESVKAIEDILNNAISKQSLEDENAMPQDPETIMVSMIDQLNQAFGSVQVIREILVDYVNQYNGFGANQDDSTDPERAEKVQALGNHISCAFDSVKAIENILQNVESAPSIVA